MKEISGTCKLKLVQILADITCPPVVISISKDDAYEESNNKGSP